MLRRDRRVDCESTDVLQDALLPVPAAEPRFWQFIFLRRAAETIAFNYVAVVVCAMTLRPERLYEVSAAFRLV